MVKKPLKEQNNIYSKRFSAILLVVVVCLIGQVSAMEWDNVYSYDENTKTATIENWFGIGADLAYLTLTSPQNVVVARGVDKLVGEFNFTTTGDFQDVFGDIYLEDVRSGNEISRGKQFKYKKYKDILVDDYETVCEDIIVWNGTEQNCIEVEVGSHWEVQMDWTPIINPTNVFYSGITYEIGIFVDVERDDYGDWIPFIMGIEIDEWATWTESLNTNIIKYLDLENSSLYDLTNSLYNDTIGGNPTFPTGLIGNAIACDGNDWVEMSAGRDWVSSDSTYSVSLWINGTTTADPQIIFDLRENTDRITVRVDSGVVEFSIDNNDTLDFEFGATASIIDGTWHHLVYTQNNKDGKAYLDGSNIKNDTTVAGLQIGTTPSGAALCANGGLFSNGPFTGWIDELGIWNRTLTSSEVVQLYNGGVGMTYIGVFDNAPNITLNSPTVDTNYTTPQNLTINFTVYDDINLSDVKLYVNNILNQTNSSGVNNTDYLFYLTNLKDGNYTMNGVATDNKNQSANSSDVTIFIDTIFPQAIIESPTGIYGIGKIGNNETLNVTFTDVHLDTCWYNYNGTNITIEGCLTATKNSTVFLLETNNVNMTLYSNDTFGNLNSTFIEWDYNLTEISQTFPATSIESASETFTSNVSYNSSAFSVITGTLTFNGTEHIGTRTGTGDSAIFSTTATMPSIAAETNLTSYWTVGLTDVSGIVNYNLTSNNVTISIINLSLCGSPLTIPFWNFTILNETNVVEINSTFEATFSVKQTGSTATNSFSFADTTSNNSQFDFCMSPSTESYTISTAIKLTKSGFVDKFYNYQDIVITNVTRTDNLYMMATGDSTSFIVHVTDVSATDITEAEVRVQRYYPGTGEWLTTEILTTNYVGKAVGHLLSEDADYRFHIYQDGSSVYNSSATKITCAVAPCTVTLVIPIESATGYEETENLDSTLVYSSTTNIFTYTYSDTSGTLSRSRLFVFAIAPSNATITTVCNETKTTSSGVMTCSLVGQTNGTYQASGYITRTGDEFLDKRIYGILGAKTYDSMGADGVLWGIFILIAIIMLGISRPSLAIIFGTVGLITLWLIEIINIGVVSIVSVIAVAIILLMRIGRE